MADVLDEASNLEEQQRLSALNKIKIKEDPPIDFDGKHCVDCDDDIHEIRLNLGKFRCVHCQEELERREKLFRKK